MKVLLIEDDPATVEAVELCLEAQRPELLLVSTGRGVRGVELARNDVFSIIILDLGLPDVDGMMTLEELRRVSNAPVLVTSARHDPEVIAKVLELGADDYILKPFDYRHLLSRLDCVIHSPHVTERRTGGKITIGALTVDFDTPQVTIEGKPVELTPIEWKFLAELATNAGRIVPVGILARNVWGSDSVDRYVIESFVSRLKTKLGGETLVGEILVSEYGSGYRLLPSGE